MILAVKSIWVHHSDLRPPCPVCSFVHSWFPNRIIKKGKREFVKGTHTVPILKDIDRELLVMSLENAHVAPFLPHRAHQTQIMYMSNICPYPQGETEAAGRRVGRVAHCLHSCEGPGRPGPSSTRTTHHGIERHCHEARRPGNDSRVSRFSCVFCVFSQLFFGWHGHLAKNILTCPR